MKSLADGNHYTFCGILQPVAGIGNINKYSQDVGTLEFVKHYRIFYPLALEHIKETEYLTNFTNIFNNVQEPFFDDCHVKKQYQKIIADSVYSLIEKKMKISDFQ